MPTKKTLMLIGLLLGAQSFATDLKILTGCWKATVHGSDIEERWGATDGDLMLGTSKTVSKGVAVSFEFLKIAISSKKTVYTPFIDGKELASFTLDGKVSSATKLVFKNAANDFPKQIVYEQEKDALRVSLSGDPTQDLNYTLNKIQCE